MSDQPTGDLPVSAELTGNGWRMAGRAVVSFAIVGLIFGFAIPKLTGGDYNKAWHHMTELTVAQVVWLNVASLWNIVSYWFMLRLTLPGMTWGQACVVNNASTAVANTVPGGGALGMGVTFKFLTSWGFGGPAISRHVLVVGLWNNFLKLGLPIVAVALIAFDGDPSPALITGAVTGLVALAVALVLVWAILASDRLARAIGGWAGRVVTRVVGWFGRDAVTGWDDAAARFRTDTADMVRSKAVWLSIAGIIDHLALYLVLLLSLRFVGIDEAALSWRDVLAAFAVIRLASALPITPGGLGVVEGGLILLLEKLVGDGNADVSAITAAVLIYRFVTYVLPIIIGGACFGHWMFSSRWRVDGAGPPSRTAIEQVP